MATSRHGTPWTRDEHVIAFHLYCQLPFGKLHHRNPQIIELAHVLGRTPDSLAMKLSNFARLDPALQARGIRGLSSGAKGEQQVWQEFALSPEDLAYESERLLAERLGKRVEDTAEIVEDDLPFEGKERETIVKQRVNQSFFRRRVLSAYDYRCCVTGLDLPKLLVASHIVPWSLDPANRLNPRNGLCLNALHDRAFDSGLMWIDEDLLVRFSSDLPSRSKSQSDSVRWLVGFEGKPLLVSRDFSPDPVLLRRHRELARPAP